MKTLVRNFWNGGKYVYGDNKQAFSINGLGLVSTSI